MYLTATQNNSTVLIIWAVCIGVVLGYIGNFVSKAIMGPFVRALLFKDAIGEESAVSLREVGFLYNKLLMIAIRDGSSLRNIVSVVGGNLPTITAGKKTAIDYEKALFYIPEEKRDVTVGRFEARGNGLLSVLAVAVIGIVVVVLIFKFAPYIVSMIDSLAGGFKNEPDVLN